MEFTVNCTYPQYEEQDKFKIEIDTNSEIENICEMLDEKKDVKYLNILFNYQQQQYHYYYQQTPVKDQSTRDKELEKISCSLSQYLKLETLFIKIEKYCGFQSSQVKTLINSLLQIGPKLTHLDIFVMEGNQINLQGAEYLAEGISNCLNLKTLRIKIKDGNNISKNGTIALGNAFGNCINLQELLIYIEGQDHQLGPEGVKGLSDGIKKLRNLNKLSIRIWWRNQLGVDGALYLTNYLPFLPELKSLYLEFGTGNYYTYQGAVHISNALKSCKNLEELTFIMWADSSIGGEGFKILCEGFQELTNLKQFKILFSGDSNFDTQSLIYLRNVFQNLQKLEQTTIKLDPSQIYLQETKQLILELQNNHFLRKLNFSVAYPYKYNQQNNDQVINYQYILKKLKRLVIMK